jgi:hypothetical protein
MNHLHQQPLQPSFIQHVLITAPDVHASFDTLVTASDLLQGKLKYLVDVLGTAAVGSGSFPTNNIDQTLL